MKILITGGAGFIGSVLVRQLLKEGYKVRVLDVLLFGGESIVDLLNEEHFEFQKGDIRNEDDLVKAVEGIDMIVHLAAIVGDPACAKDPSLARDTNLEATKKLYKIANERNIRRFIFSSTCSNYGKMADPDQYVDENSDLAPVSLYAETKVSAEKFLLNSDHTNVCKPVCLRFSTAYGLSSRMRFDLTVNEFTKELAMGRELVVYGEQFWRPYCNVYDLARAIILALKAEEKKVAFDVFNVGDTEENYQKRMIVDLIKKQIPASKIRYVEKDEDPRDYRVSFEKIKNRLGFDITIKVEQGIKQIIKIIKEGIITFPDDKRYRNS